MDFHNVTPTPETQVSHSSSSEEDLGDEQLQIQRIRTVIVKHSGDKDVAAKESTEKESDDTRLRYRRRASHDERTVKPRRFLLDVEATKQLILEQEDTDGDFQITVNDSGPKVFKVGTANSGGYQKFDIRGTYMISNLLQELALAAETGRKHIIIDESRLNENPVSRLARMIDKYFWRGLTRRIDAEGLEQVCSDPKNRRADRNPRIYIPHDEHEVYEYYQCVAASRPHLRLEVEYLPRHITPAYVKSINGLPGILSLAMEKVIGPDGQTTMCGVPYVVPGGRFNEQYGWDSYFECLGLLIDGRVDLCKGMVDNFVYQIKHYGKILNANRSYYLTRSQPPFLTDMALVVYPHLVHSGIANETAALAWLANVFRAAIREYYEVWMSPPRLDARAGLSTYHCTGIGMPPETESTHFDHIVEPYAKKYGVDVPTFKNLYNTNCVAEPELDEYFVHDRAVRESGHDTTYRLEKRCADLATIDLNSLLYKYEVDIAEAIRDKFGDCLTMDSRAEEMGRPAVERSAVWFDRAALRRRKLDSLCWNEAAALYFDYDVKHHQQHTYETVTTLWPMWAGCASDKQAELLVRRSLPKFEACGGLVSGTEKSRGPISLQRPNRQWDYPFGWAPHQIMAWHGLQKYGYKEEASRLAYRWLYTITKSFVDFNGVVPEKFDVVNMTHHVKVEYGNVGIDFKLVPREGFGWMNASFKVGLTYLNSHMRRALGALTPPESLFKEQQDMNYNCCSR